MINCAEKVICVSCKKVSSCNVLKKLAPLVSELENIPGVDFFFDLEKCNNAAVSNSKPLEYFLKPF